ncbi:YihY/virulence factor BrkB family protein [Croceicoccus sp. F390]|uniref:YihY/virulence factor BrkB family protein n=1 Tax=Croceicoccus esteveae TaxID=3075597 RepID=A0ABU2ZFC3_9SPHN|nr:YihY/virulence factor BrkB family protein [Croceicoccus sp. F390]MDT0575302.1 YihY/virulence factor BrkB family protein [Croceicoccus sp. F390]
MPINAPGAIAKSPVSIPRAGWIRIVKRVYVMAGFHNLTLLAGGVAFFTFLAITPLIAATVMIYGLLGNVDLVEKQMRAVVEVVPSDAASLIEDQLLGAVTTSGEVAGLALVIALFFAIYGGMRAASGLISALNVINEELETRNIVKLTLRAATLTIAAIGIALIGVTSGAALTWLQRQTSVLLGGPWIEFLIKLATYAVAVALASAGFAMIMRYGPDRNPAKWRWLAPGAVLATFLWIGVSFGFSLYVAYVSDYNATYGSLSAIVVFLMWLFLSAYGILIGALFNAEAERQTLMDSTRGPDRPAGERGAVLADSQVTQGTSLGEAQEKRQQRARRTI